MAQLSVTGSIPAKLDTLFGTTIQTTLPIKTFFKKASGTTSDPADFTAVANSSAIAACTVTVTGAAVGDAVIAYGVVSGLAANSFVLGAFVSATDTVTFLIGNAINSSVTTTVMTVNVIVADLT